MHTKLITTACLCLLAFSTNVIAEQETAAAQDNVSGWDSFISRIEPFTFTLYWENDGTLLKRNNAHDRHYSNGLAATFAHQPQYAEGFQDFFTLGESFNHTAAGYILGQQIFTPENINSPQLQHDDRPYAGYLFGGIYLQRANENVFDHAQLDLGVVGPSSKADTAQKDIHDLFNSDIPQGWEYQIRDEFTFQFTFRRKWRADLEPITLFDTSLDHQLIPQIDLALGNVYRHVSAGATWRIGINLPDDFGPGRLADPASATGNGSKNTGGFVFLRATGRAVEHNMFLEGNNYKHSHGVDAEPLVGELQAGISLYTMWSGWRLQANYSQTFITEQFDTQNGSDSHGALMLTASHGY